VRARLRAKQEQEKAERLALEAAGAALPADTAPLAHSKSVPALPSPSKLKGLDGVAPSQDSPSGEVAVVVGADGAALPPPQNSPRL
jgi:hypothetical protein